MIDVRRRQRSFGDGFITEAVDDLQEPWMRQVDALLDDDQLLALVYEALTRRHPQSRTRGRPGVSAARVLRLLLLKHLRNWSYATLEREVRANLVYRAFTRVGGDKVPDAKTLGRWGLAVGPEVVERLHAGRRLRLDTTVVETNIHYPTDSSLLGDGVRVLTRTMKTVASITGDVGTKLRDRRRSVNRRLMEIGRIARSKGAQRHEKLTRAYQQLFAATSRVVGQAKGLSREIDAGVKRAAAGLQHATLETFRLELETFVPRVQQVLRQARARILGGDTHVAGKVLSLFEPSTEVMGRARRASPMSSANW